MRHASGWFLSKIQLWCGSSYAMSGPLVNPELLPDLDHLPDLPGKVSGFQLFGATVGFQLINCTAQTLDVKTYNQHDGARAIPNKTYSIQPKQVVYCTAAANDEPFDIQYNVNGQLLRAPQATRVYAIQVGPVLLHHSSVLDSRPMVSCESHDVIVASCTVASQAMRSGTLVVGF
jgi:hypothetical protein